MTHDAGTDTPPSIAGDQRAVEVLIEAHLQLVGVVLFIIVVGVIIRLFVFGSLPSPSVFVGKIGQVADDACRDTDRYERAPWTFIVRGVSIVLGTCNHTVFADLYILNLTKDFKIGVNLFPFIFFWSGVIEIIKCFTLKGLHCHFIPFQTDIKRTFIYKAIFYAKMDKSH